jgi:hypothetical protein
MRLNRRTLLACVVCALVAGCGGIATSTADNAAQKAQNAIDNRANATTPYLPPWPSVEYNNYTKAQKLYASPTTIQWCTTTWGNASAPLVTVPIAGKLTSSSVSFFPSSREKLYGGDGTSEYTKERRSLDSMYHGSPPPYRYGFTPGGDYVDFSSMPVLCSTKPLKFQREKTEIALTVDAGLDAATTKAEGLLKSKDPAGATAALADALKAGG